MTFGSAQWDANFSAALAQGIAALRKSGARVALSLLPCYRPVKASAGFWPERGDDDRTRHVNVLLKAAAAADAANVATVEPPAEFCTNPAIATSRRQNDNFGLVCCSTAALASSANVNALGEPNRVMQFGVKLNF